MLYDVPGAPYAGREFEMDQLIDAVPYMYCTKQIAIFAITQLSEVGCFPFSPNFPSLFSLSLSLTRRCLCIRFETL